MTTKSNNISAETYYTLRAVHTAVSGNNNRQLMAGADTIHIGQTSDCEWHFDNPTNYVDEIYAVIRPGQIRGEWALVPTTEHVGVSVNGSKVGLIHYLCNGDIIAFDGERQELRFNIHRDGRYSADIGVAYISTALSAGTKWLIGIIVAAVVACLWLGVLVPTLHDKVVNEKLNDLRLSVLQLSVDSVYYVAKVTATDGTQHDSILGRYSYNFDGGGMVSGTAFIADGKLLITARHCIEPWLNDTTINRATCPSDLPEGPVRWAFEAETINQLSGHKDSLWLRSQCILSYGDTNSQRDTIMSTDFAIERSRDDIVPKGNFKEHCYWRSITRRHEKKAQTLGDVAWTTTGSKTSTRSGLHIADTTYISSKLNMGQKLYFLGYPNYNERKSFDYQEGTLKKDYEGSELLWHDGDIAHGYSGGPVVVLEEDKVMGTLKAIVVGVISIADSKGLNRSYSVPITEINKEENDE